MLKRYLIVMKVMILLSFSSPVAGVTTPLGEVSGVGLTVKNFKQFEGGWERDPMNDLSGTKIGRRGCLITSMANILYYHGLRWIPDDDTKQPEITNSLNPGSYNKWLMRPKIQGYSPGTADVHPGATKKFYYKHIPWNNWYKAVVPNDDCYPFSYTFSSGCYLLNWSDPKAQSILVYDLMLGQPDILRIDGYYEKGTELRPLIGHFVAASGFSNGYPDDPFLVEDPGRGYKSRLYGIPLAELYHKLMLRENQATQLALFGADRPAYKLREVRRYAEGYGYGKPALSWLGATVHSPVEIQMIDPKGRVTGYDPNTNAVLQDDPKGLYYTEIVSSLEPVAEPEEPIKVLWIDTPAAGNYIFKMFGTGDGPYTIDLNGETTEGISNLSTSLTGTATPSLQQTYRVTYSPTGEASLTSTNQAPLAHAGANQTGEQSYEIQLDGSATSDPDGDPLKYSWSFVSRPDGSNAALSDASVTNPHFTPDLPGMYVLQLVANDYFTDSEPSTVTITAIPIQSRISVTPNFSAPLSAGSGFLSFDVNNTGRAGVSSGIINMTLKDPDGVTIYSGSQAFSITVGETKTVSVPVTIPSLKFGNYTLTYTQSDETRTGRPTAVAVPNTVVFSLSLDKPSYKIRETANVTVNLTNTGKFSLENAAITVSLPDAGLTSTTSVSLPQASSSQILSTLLIPAIITAGQHDVNATLALPSGSSIAHTAKITIPESNLSISYAGSSTVLAGEAISLTIENTGGVDTSYTTEKLSITDNRGATIYQGDITGTVLSMEKKTISPVLVPSQAATGPVSFYSTLRDTKTGKLSSFYKPFIIDGLASTVSVRSDKDLYMNTEAITGMSVLMTGHSNIESGNLDVKVLRYGDAAGSGFMNYLPKANSGVSFSYPYGIAVGPDDTIYVADTGNDRIQMFGRDGNLMKVWGSYGSGDGQFSSPFDVAVGPDGSVYVVDTGNGRIQQFDSNGNFVRKVGGWGWFTDIAVSLDGYIYVVDGYFYTVQKYDGNGTLIKQWNISGPKGIAVSPDGFVYVTTDCGVWKYDNNGTIIKNWGRCGSADGALSWPEGITVAHDGSVYVADTGNNRIQKFSSDGSFMAKWSDSGDGEFNWPFGVAVNSDGTVYVADSHNSRIQMMPASSSPVETLFEDFLPISQPANISQDYPTDIGTLNVTGKLYLQATLKNSLGQSIGTSEYPFYIINGDTALQFKTDKKIYKPGEPVTITGEVRNLARITATSLSLQLSANSQNVYSVAFDVAAGGSYPFTFITTAETDGVVTLKGFVSQNHYTLVEVLDRYEVSKPAVTLTISAPDVVGREPFDLDVEVKNTGKTDFNGQLSVGGNGNTIDSQLVNIPVGGTKLLQYRQEITAYTLYAATITGDANASSAKSVRFGESATIAFANQPVERKCSPLVCSPGDWQCYMRGPVCQDVVKPYAEGKVGITVTITNTGYVDEQLEVNFQLSGQGSVASGQTKAYYLSKGGSATDTLYFDLTKGSYQLSALSNQPYATAQTSFTVGKENDVTMTNTVGGQGTNGFIPVTVSLTNNGINEINGSIPFTITNNQGKALWRGAAQVSGLRPQTPANYLINVDSSGIVSGAYNAEMTLYSTSGRELASNQTQIRVAGPIFEVTSIPVYPTFTVGKQALFTFSIKNTGTQAGTTSFNVKAMGILSQSVTDTLHPGEERSHTFTFSVPEDAVENDYYADYILTPVLSQGTKGQVRFHVAGVKIGTTATLDKPAYINGDTAVLTLAISKLSQFEDGDYIAIIRYGTHHDMKPFTLTNQGTTLTFSVSLPVITGENLFYSIHFQSGRAISRNTIFINKAQPDLVVDNLSTSQSAIRTFKIEATVTNQGETASGASAVAFYDGTSDNVLTGDSPNSTALQAGKLGTVPLPSLAPGESKTVSFSWDVIGKSGKHTIYAVADPGNIVMERIEVNNTQSIEIIVPNFAVEVATTEPAYKANRDAGIIVNIANLTSGATYQGLNLGITISGPLGNIPLDTVKEITNLPPAQVFSYGFNWNTGATQPGDYTLKGRLLEGFNTLAEGSAVFAILPTTSISGIFTLSKDPVIQGFDLNIDYTLMNTGNIDLSGGELKAEFIAGQGDTVSTAYTRTFGALQVMNALSDSIVIDKLQVEPGDYIVRLTATVAGEAFVIGERKVKVLPPLEIKKGLSAMPRVLVLIDEAEGADAPTIDLNEIIVSNALNSVQAYYQIIRDKKGFKEAMRSGIYNTFILVGKGPLEDHLDEEVVERINSGEGLILINYVHLEDEKFRDVTGVKAEGYLSDKQRIVDLSQSPLSLPGTVNISGKVERLIIQSAQAVTAGTIMEDNYSHPALVLNPYGKGKTVIFAFDPAESAKINGTAPYVQLLGNAVLYAAQQEIKPVPGWTLPVEIDIKPIGADFNLKAVEKMNKGSLILFNPQGTVEESPDGQSVTWEFHLGKDNTKRFFYLAKLPEDSGSFNLTTDVYYIKDGSYKPYNTYPLTVEVGKGLIDLEMGILNSLRALAGGKDGYKLTKVIQEYEEIMNGPLHDAKEKEDAIKGLLEVIEELKELNIDITNVRLDLDTLLKIFERIWVERQEEKNDD